MMVGHSSEGINGQPIKENRKNIKSELKKKAEKVYLSLAESRPSETLWWILAAFDLFSPSECLFQSWNRMKIIGERHGWVETTRLERKSEIAKLSTSTTRCDVSFHFYNHFAALDRESGGKKASKRTGNDDDGRSRFWNVSWAVPYMHHPFVHPTTQPSSSAEHKNLLTVYRSMEWSCLYSPPHLPPVCDPRNNRAFSINLTPNWIFQYFIIVIKRTTGFWWWLSFTSFHGVLIFGFFLLFFPPLLQMSGLSKNPLAGLAALGLAGAIPSNNTGMNPSGITNCTYTSRRGEFWLRLACQMSNYCTLEGSIGNPFHD